MNRTTVFGSCRVDRISTNNHINHLTTFTHCTKEVIQLIQFLEMQKKDLPYSHCFRTCIREHKDYIDHIDHIENVFQLWRDSDTVMIEICSRKKYIAGDHYLHHLCVDPRFPKYYNKQIIHHVEHQSDAEIEEDMLTLHRLVNGRRLIFVTHYFHEDFLSISPGIVTRKHLIELVETICNRHGWMCINPEKLLKDIPWQHVMTDDLGHYTAFGEKTFLQRVESVLI